MNSDIPLCFAALTQDMRCFGLELLCEYQGVRWRWLGFLRQPPVWNQRRLRYFHSEFYAGLTFPPATLPASHYSLQHGWAWWRTIATMSSNLQCYATMQQLTEIKVQEPYSLGFLHCKSFHQTNNSLANRFKQTSYTLQQTH